MVKTNHLCLYTDLSKPDTNYRVQLEGEKTLERLNPNGWVLCSESPIFALHDRPYVPAEKDSYHIVFVVPENSFRVIANIPANYRAFAWYSLGLASLIAILPRRLNPRAFLASFPTKEILGHEIWLIKKSVFQNSKIGAPGQKTSALKEDWPKEIPENVDLQRIIHELFLNFNCVLKRARILMPSLLPTLLGVRVSVGREVAQIVKHESLLRRNLQMPSETSDGTSEVRLYASVRVLVSAHSQKVCDVPLGFRLLNGPCFVPGSSVGVPHFQTAGFCPFLWGTEFLL